MEIRDVYVSSAPSIFELSPRFQAGDEIYFMVLYNTTQVMVEEFTDPVLQGFTGNYDKSRRHRLLGAVLDGCRGRFR